MRTLPRRYDHKIREAIVATGNPRLFPHLRIPPSTARTWIRRGCPPVVSATPQDADVAALQAELTPVRAKAAFYFLPNFYPLYLHAVIDNFSRKILAWDLQGRVMGRTTTAVVEQAARFLGGGVVSLMTDSGIETVDDLLAASPLRRVLAQVEIPESNSMIEAFWKSLRHQWPPSGFAEQMPLVPGPAVFR
ncbi:MAG: DDE-type integrase/transposase/recombinase [Deltaproteobacteria bacterium]|nr:DDE-type integrase/transposase/recombinase [Deltaproteobacteria bacterium]